MMEETKKMQEIIDKRFRDEKVIYFTPSDAFVMLVGQSYLRYEYHNGERGRIIIWQGSNKFDEVPIKICTSAAELEALINAII